jgi:Bifunctional DNA primase/polymerase, N-terminal
MIPSGRGHATPIVGDKAGDFNAGAALFQGIPPGLSPGETAALLASRGLKVFPCDLDSKKPATPHGFKDASTDVRLSGSGARQWVTFKSAPGTAVSCLALDCNLAFEPGSAGLLVVDIDPKHGGDETWAQLEAKYGKAPPTLEVLTPSGGRHLYFLGTGPSTGGKLGKGIDTRGIGGYVLLPPSVIKGRHYVWLEGPIAPLPQWLAEALAEENDADSDPAANEAAFQSWQAEGNDGGRFEYHLSRIGDHEGGNGFYAPMMSAAGAGVRLGMVAYEIITRIAETARTANRCNHTAAEIADRIAKLPAAVASFQARDARERREAAELDAVAEDPEPQIEPDIEEPDASSEAPHKPKSAQSAKPQPLTWTTPEAAIAKTRASVQTWLDRDSEHEPTLTIVKSAAGTGKSTTMDAEQLAAKIKDRQRVEMEEREEAAVLEAIEAAHRDGPEAIKKLIEKTMHEDLGDLSMVLGKMACAVPRHKLGEEIQGLNGEERIAAGFEKNPILRGRNATNCQRWELVSKAQQHGFSPGALCQRTLPSGEVQTCPFFEGCSYQANQKAVKEEDYIIITHKHLALPWLDSLALKSRKRMWIDEDPSKAFLLDQSESRISDEQLADLVNDSDIEALNGRVPGVESLEQLSKDLLTGLSSPSGLQARHLDGWTPGALRRAARARLEVESRRRGKLNPSLDDAKLLAQIERVGVPPKKLAFMIFRLADEVAVKRKGEVYSLYRDPQTRQIRMRGRVPTDTLPPNLLITDATASPEILAAVFPGYKQELVEIAVQRNARITQTKEPVFSQNWLLKENHLPEVVEWIKQLAARYSNLVVITTKRIRRAITGEEPGKLHEFCEAHGARIGHYGNLRGSNAFKDCDALVILGRQQPTPEEIEDEAKAYWYDTPTPLKLIKPVNGKRFYQEARRPYLMRDGSEAEGRVQLHPDPRCQAVLAMSRENEMVQALDRARLIWCDKPKDVFILCDIPLPGVEIDRLVPWDVLRGADRLRQALAACEAGAKNALPLVSTYLSATFPELWKTEKAAERWLENSPEIKYLFSNPHPSNIQTIGQMGVSKSEPLNGPRELFWRLVEYRLRGRRGGRSSHALVQEGHVPAAAIAQALGVDPEAIIVLEAAREAESTVEKRPRSKPTIGETENSLWPREVHIRLPFSAEPAPRCPPPKPLSFAAMLREDEGEGVLLTELVCQSDWGPTPELPPPAVH